MIYDVAVIGAGVIGCHISRRLSRYNLNICLLEKQADVAMSTSSANSGIVHAGYDAEPGSLKARLNIRGNRIMQQVARELDVPFKRIGSLVLAFDRDDICKIGELYERGLKNGVQGMQILSRSEIEEKEPAVSKEAIAALYAPDAGIICPYQLAINAAENAVENGVNLFLNCKVIRIEREKTEAGNGACGFFLLITSSGEFKARYIVNCAGLFADKIASMVGDNSFTIRPRKGEYILLDKSQGNIVKTVIFQTPTKMGKGILVTPTVDGNLLIGPSALDIDDKNDHSTTREGLAQVLEGALKSVPGIDVRSAITSFSGLRAVPSQGDFIISESQAVKGFINVAGIESPGLTAAPAIAEYVEDILREAGLELIPKEDYNPVRQPVKRFRDLYDDMQEDEIRELIRRNPLYGQIVCRCEMVTEAEVVDSIRRPAGARTLDGIKRRTRAGMGRCQGGFCTSRVVEILSRELGIPMEEVTKSGEGSWILAGKTKPGWAEETEQV